MPKLICLSDLPLGQSGIVHSFSDNEISLRLLEMGCLPGERLEFVGRAPFGCPMCLKLGECYFLTLRKDEAANLMLEI